jgi:phosphatidylglycerol:prolipoprotein diacylglycerol transferase
MYLVGFVVGYLLFVRRYNRGLFALNPEESQNLITYIMVGMMIGARLIYVTVYNPSYYLENLSEIPAIWHGGLSFHGAALGFIVAVLAFGRRHGYKFYQIMDAVVIGSAIGIFFGRLGNFINGELYGRVTDGTWGIIFPGGGPAPRHPSQLYQAFCEGLFVFILLHVIQKYEQVKGYAPAAIDLNSKSKESKKKKREPIVWKRTGILSCSFLILYGIGRFVVEFFREPDAQLGYYFGWMTMGQILCSIMIVVGIFLLTAAIKKPVPAEY